MFGLRTWVFADWTRCLDSEHECSQTEHENHIFNNSDKPYISYNEIWRPTWRSSSSSLMSLHASVQACTFENHGNLRPHLTNWPLEGTVHSREWLSKCYKTPRWPFSKLCSNLCGYCWSKLQERCPTKARLHVLSIAGVGTSMICLRSIKSSLPSLYPLRHSRDKIYQALSCFSVLQAMESWVGPGNEATWMVQ